MTIHAPPRWEGALKAAGQAVFPAETPAENLLYAVLVEAPIGCGEILSIDATTARQVPGFADLIAYDEAQALRPFGVTTLIQKPVVHFPGQPVALAVGETLAAAHAVARAVRIEAQAGPAITAMDQALEQAYGPSAALRQPIRTERGDVEAALARAALTVRGHYETAVNNHHPMEPTGVVCWWEGERAIVHTSTQAVFGTRSMIAHAFQTPVENVQVVCRFLGGGFGCKGQLWWPWMLQAMLAARRTGRPVRLEQTRAQHFTLAGRRQETWQDLVLGFDAEGRLTGIDHQVLGQTATHGEYCDATASVSRWLYACPNVTTGHKVVRTNEPQPVPMRAPGVAPGLFALESALDEAARALDLDPVEIRIRNFAAHDQQLNLPWSSNGLLDCYRQGAERFGWADRPAGGSVRDGRWRLGFGMASCCYPAHRAAAQARAVLAPDMGLTIQCGTQDMGSGTYTVLAQMAAEALGVDTGSVLVELGDTSLVEGPVSAGSMVTASIYPAIDEALTNLRGALADRASADPASPLAGLPPESLEVGGGLIRSRDGNAAEPLADLMARCPGGLEASGAFALPEAAEFSGMGHGAVFVEVGVDPDLGEARVRRVCAAFAAGRILNPLLARSQHVGGLIGGIGMALHEQTVTDVASGRILGQTFADYLIPVQADMPDFEIVMVEQDEPWLPGGVKGIGMLGTAGVQAAIANAVFDAVGRRVRRLPIRIEDILA
jgi:xanthine dehydrogenase YagR molybdenum-binding subunit